MSSIWWIRRDLRLQDNLTLKNALENPPVLPVFILDPVLLNTAPERRLTLNKMNVDAIDKMSGCMFMVFMRRLDLGMVDNSFFAD